MKKIFLVLLVLQVCNFKLFATVPLPHQPIVVKAFSYWTGKKYKQIKQSEIILKQNNEYAYTLIVNNELEINLNMYGYKISKIDTHKLLRQLSPNTLTAYKLLKPFFKIGNRLLMSSYGILLESKGKPLMYFINYMDSINCKNVILANENTFREVLLKNIYIQEIPQTDSTMFFMANENYQGEFNFEIRLRKDTIKGVLVADTLFKHVDSGKVSFVAKMTKCNNLAWENKKVKVFKDYKKFDEHYVYGQKAIFEIGNYKFNGLFAYEYLNDGNIKTLERICFFSDELPLTNVKTSFGEFYPLGYNIKYNKADSTIVSPNGTAYKINYSNNLLNIQIIENKINTKDSWYWLENEIKKAIMQCNRIDESQPHKYVQFFVNNTSLFSSVSQGQDRIFKYRYSFDSYLQD